MYFDGQVKIGRAQNGFMISMNDPKIVAANKKRDLSRSNRDTIEPYRDPERVYVFDDIKELTTFIEQNLETALPKDDFSSSFDAAAAAASSGD